MQEMSNTPQAVVNHTPDSQSTDHSSQHFHRMALAHPRSVDNDKPKLHPIKGLIAGLFLALVIQVVVFLAFAIGGVIGGIDEEKVFLSDDPLNPTSNATLLLSLSAVIPVTFLAARIAGYRSRFLVSVAGRIRWDIFAIATAVTIGIHLITQVSIILLASDLETRQLDGKDLWMIPVVLLLVPFQAFAEELFVRGFLPQIFGAGLKNPWLAYFPGALLWVALHGYNVWGLVVIGYSAIIYGILVHKTGGLEASTALHTVGNFVAFLLPLFLVVEDTDNIPWESAVFEMVTTTITVALTYYLIRRFALIPRDENHRV